MKTYEILVNTKLANNYMQGRMMGIIYVLTGMPKKEYAMMQGENDILMRFDATEEQSKAVHDCLNDLYPNAYVGMREVE